MADLKGKGVIYAVNGITYTAGITIGGTEKAMHQSLAFTRSADIAYIKDSDGETVTAAIANKKKTLSITIVPGGTAIADGRSLADKFNIVPGTRVVVADADSTTVDDEYYVVSSRVNRTVDGAETIDLELEAFEANDLSNSAA